MDEKQFIAQTLTHSLHIQKVVSAFYSDLNQDFVSRDVYKRQLLLGPRRQSVGRCQRRKDSGVLVSQFHHSRLHLLQTCLLYTSRCV